MVSNLGCTWEPPGALRKVLKPGPHPSAIKLEPLGEGLGTRHYCQAPWVITMTSRIGAELVLYQIPCCFWTWRFFDFSESRLKQWQGGGADLKWESASGEGSPTGLLPPPFPEAQAGAVVGSSWLWIHGKKPCFAEGMGRALEGDDSNMDGSSLKGLWVTECP